MKGFGDILKHVHENNLCTRCGGCVSFCTAMNYGALDMDENGYPCFKDEKQCIECGICHMICPETNDLDDDIKNMVHWEAPAGRIISTNIFRTTDQAIRQNATNGGAVTGILMHLMHNGLIDAAVVSRQQGMLSRQPSLASSPDELLDTCGSFFDTSHGMVQYSEYYAAHNPSYLSLEDMKNFKASRVAFVGTPCQVAALRKMQALGVVPSDCIHLVLGLFCSGNFAFDDKAGKHLEKVGRFNLEDVRKVDIKDKLHISLKDGNIHVLPLEELDFNMRPACRFCGDYTAEFADLSFGGIGSEEGWTTVIARTQTGLDVLKKTEGATLEAFNSQETKSGLAGNENKISKALHRVLRKSELKKDMAGRNRETLNTQASTKA